jgi:hypothetical protein
MGIAVGAVCAAGLLRTESIESGSTLSDSPETGNAEELRNYLIEKRMSQVGFGFLKQLATHGTGRRFAWSEIEFLLSIGFARCVVLAMMHRNVVDALEFHQCFME